MARKAKTAAKTAKKAKAVKEPKKIVAKAPKKAARKAARKAPKKAAPKRAAPAKKLEVYKLHKNAPGERYLVLANGQPVKHVAELAEVLADIEDHVFDHHVNPERNDFHNWVKEVFKDIELAKKMLGVSRKEDLQLVIYKHAAHKAWK